MFKVLLGVLLMSVRIETSFIKEYTSDFAEAKMLNKIHSKNLCVFSIKIEDLPHPSLVYTSPHPYTLQSLSVTQLVAIPL